MDSFDAIVLTGGAATRLGGDIDKAALVVGGRTLLERTLDAVAGARRVVVVGATTTTDPRVTVVREDPTGGGPAAAIGAGVRALDGEAPVVVLACDMPQIAGAVPVLLAALAARPDIAGVLARDDGRVQQLAGAHRLAALHVAVESHGALHGASVRSLMDLLDPLAVDVPAGSTADIDTWADARAAGADAGNPPRR